MKKIFIVFIILFIKCSNLSISPNSENNKFFIGSWFIANTEKEWIKYSFAPDSFEMSTPQLGQGHQEIDTINGQVFIVYHIPGNPLIARKGTWLTFNNLLYLYYYPNDTIIYSYKFNNNYDSLTLINNFNESKVFFKESPQN